MQIAMDVPIISLPIWPLIQVSLNIKRKLQILLMFCTGFLYVLSIQFVQFHTNQFPELQLWVACDCNRLSNFQSPLMWHVCYLISQPKSGRLWRFHIDDNTPAIYWSVVECDVAIICACMPALPSLLKNIFPSIFGEPSKKYYSNISPPQQFPSSDVSVPLDRIKVDASWQVTSSQTKLVQELETQQKSTSWQLELRTDFCSIHLLQQSP